MKEIKKKILIIDDDKWIGKLLIDNLSKADFEPVYAENGKAAFELLKNYRPDLIILDIQMPVMNGYEFLEQFRSKMEYRTIPVIILSAKGNSEDIVKGLKYGADNYVVKPFNPSVIISHINNIFRITASYSSHNKLTGLPGDREITEYVNSNLAIRKEFAFCLIDLDNLRQYNKHYGYENGDKILLHTAFLIKKILGYNQKNFVGHYSGDDFIAAVSLDSYRVLLDKLIKEFDKSREQFYSSRDVTRNYTNVRDKNRNLIKIPLISISIGVVPIKNDSTRFHSLIDLYDSAVEVQKTSKTISGSSYFIENKKDTKIEDSVKIKGIKILINEKYSYNIRIIKHFLIPFGFNIIESLQPGNILREYKKEEPHIVILELKKDILLKIVKVIREHEEKLKLVRSYIIAVIDVAENLLQPDLLDIVKNGVENIIMPPIGKEALLKKLQEVFQMLKKSKTTRVTNNVKKDA